MNKLITPSSYLEKCPRCNNLMNLSPEVGGRESHCSQCEYTEPGGSASVITFISSCLTNYANSIGIDTTFLKDSKFTVGECMEGNGLLPLFIERAKQIQDASGLTDIPGVGIDLKVEEDIKGLLVTRVVMNKNNLHLSSNLAFLVEVLHESIDLTKTLGTKYYGNQICLDYMPSLSPVNDIQYGNSQKLHSALQVASKQQFKGAPGERK
ncbi:hypothetical protein [Microbulbifer epialgicus]|uniref:Uncharacterized protein n=1 Tax=Microbulbifer epialgicus TaxID=393907 RepID=A0ABV4NU73_9GAMM